MAHMIYETAYSVQGVGEFAKTNSFSRNPPTYTDHFSPQPKLIGHKEEEDNYVLRHLETKEKLFGIAQQGIREASIREPKGGEELYEHVAFDLSTYKTDEEKRAAAQVIGDCLRHPDFDFVKNNGKRGKEDKTQTIEQHIKGDRAVIDMGVHENTENAHCQFLVSRHVVNDQKIYGSLSLKSGAVYGPQIQQINRALEDRGLEPIYPNLVEARNSFKPGRSTREEKAAVRPTDEQVQAGEQVLNGDDPIEEIVEKYESETKKTSFVDEDIQLSNILKERSEELDRLARAKMEELLAMREQSRAIQRAQEAFNEARIVKDENHALVAELNDFKEASMRMKEALKERLEKAESDYLAETERLKIEHQDQLQAVVDEKDELIRNTEATAKAREEELSAEKDTLSQELTHKLDEIDSLSEDLEKAKRTNKDTLGLLESKTQELATEKEKRLEAEKTATDLKSELADLKLSFSQQIADQNAKFDAFVREQRQAMDKQKEDFERTIEDREREFKRTYSELNSKFEGVQQQAEKEKAEFSRSLKSASEENFKLKADVSELRGAVKGLEQENRALNSENEILREKGGVKSRFQSPQSEGKDSEPSDKAKQAQRDLQKSVDNEDERRRLEEDRRRNNPDDENDPSKKRR